MAAASRRVEAVDEALFTALQNPNERQIVLALEACCRDACQTYRTRPPPGTSTPNSPATSTTTILLGPIAASITNHDRGFDITGLNSYQRMLLHKVAVRFMMSSSSYNLRRESHASLADDHTQQSLDDTMASSYSQCVPTSSASRGNVDDDVWLNDRHSNGDDERDVDDLDWSSSSNSSSSNSSSESGARCVSISV